MTTIRTYVEVGSNRTFAGALDWPGWCRSGRDEESALAALLTAAPRYARAIEATGLPFAAPDRAAAFVVTERLRGDSGTDYGVPAMSPSSDGMPVDGPGLDRLVALLRAAWAAFDAAAEGAAGHELRKGPRGGGRDRAAMIAHVQESERSYLREVGGKLADDAGAPPAARMTAIRDAVVLQLRARAGGDEPVPGPRRRRPFWSPPCFVRRSMWHALDHAWEIEDRLQ